MEDLMFVDKGAFEEAYESVDNPRVSDQETKMKMRQARINAMDENVEDIYEQGQAEGFLAGVFMGTTVAFEMGLVSPLAGIMTTDIESLYPNVTEMGDFEAGDELVEELKSLEGEGIEATAFEPMEGYEAAFAKEATVDVDIDAEEIVAELEEAEEEEKYVSGAGEAQNYIEEQNDLTGVIKTGNNAAHGELFTVEQRNIDDLDIPFGWYAWKDSKGYLNFDRKGEVDYIIAPFTEKGLAQRSIETTLDGHGKLAELPDGSRTFIYAREHTEAAERIEDSLAFSWLSEKEQRDEERADEIRAAIEER